MDEHFELGKAPENAAVAKKAAIACAMEEADFSAARLRRMFYLPCGSLPSGLGGGVSCRRSRVDGGGSARDCQYELRQDFAQSQLRGDGLARLASGAMFQRHHYTCQGSFSFVAAMPVAIAKRLPNIVFFAVALLDLIPIFWCGSGCRWLVVPTGWDTTFVFCVASDLCALNRSVR